MLRAGSSPALGTSSYNKSLDEGQLIKAFSLFAAGARSLLLFDLAPGSFVASQTTQ
jgi:hypothetical protein